jgi:hypothetical protein
MEAGDSLHCEYMWEGGGGTLSVPFIDWRADSKGVVRGCARL